MDLMTDTSLGHRAGPGAFLPSSSHHGCTRSLPPSSNQFRRDINESCLSQRAAAFRPFIAPKSCAQGHRPAGSIATHISISPTQPVTVRLHSTDVSSQFNASNPLPHTRFSMSKGNELPPVSDFSIEGILAAVQPNLEGTIDEIAEILARSRLTLANEYGSHMPPQGEIRASSRLPLQSVAEASSSNEQLAADNVMIVPDEASLVEGSYAGSAAYGLLERLGVPPRPRRPRRDAQAIQNIGLSNPPEVASPQALLVEPRPAHVGLQPLPDDRLLRSPTNSRRLLRTTNRGSISAARTTNPVVSETYLLAGANGRPASNPPIVSESGRNYPLYSYDESDIFESVPELMPPTRLRSMQSRMQSLSLVSDLQGLAAWLYREPFNRGGGGHDAERRLRTILDRHTAPYAHEEEVIDELYE